MKTMGTLCPSGYHHNSFLATQVYELSQSHCGDDREGIL